MGPGFESQRDHNKKANRKISFFVLAVVEPDKLGAMIKLGYLIAMPLITFPTMAS